jgi:RimJ/RimL family protein N-acetyltransferase
MDFTLYQRIDGVPTMRDSDIAELYQLTEDAGLSVFDDGAINNKREFVDYVTSFNVIFMRATQAGKLVGYFYLNRIATTTAYAHFMVFPKFWGTIYTMIFGIETMKICLKEFDTIIGQMPSSNTTALNFVQRLGFHKLGSVPNLLWSESLQAPVEGTLLYMTRGDLE